MVTALQSGDTISGIQMLVSTKMITSAVCTGLAYILTVRCIMQVKQNPSSLISIDGTP